MSSSQHRLPADPTTRKAAIILNLTKKGVSEDRRKRIVDPEASADEFAGDEIARQARRLLGYSA